MSMNDSSILLLLDGEQAKTMIEALLTAYDAADCHARSVEAELKIRREEVEDLKSKLDEATRKLTVMDTAYADMDDERAEWKDKYNKLLADMCKKQEREGK